MNKAYLKQYLSPYSKNDEAQSEAEKLAQKDQLIQINEEDEVVGPTDDVCGECYS